MNNGLSTWGGLAEGINTGLRNVALMQGMKNEKEKEGRATTLFEQGQDEYKKLQSAKEEIATATTGFRNKMTELNKLQEPASTTAPTLASYTGGVPSDVGTSYDNAMPTSGKPNLRTIANQNAFREQVPKVIGEHDREIADIWNKYGFTDKAQGVTDNHYKRMEMIGKSIGPRAALTYAQSGPDGELFQGAQVKDDKDYTMITGHDGSVIRYRKDTGAYEIIKGGDNSVASHIFNKLVPGGEQSTVIQYDKSGNVKETPIGVVVPRWDPERPTASERRAARQREGKLTDIEKQELTGIRSDLRTVNRELLEVRRNAGYGVEAAKNRLPLIEAEYNDLKTREKELLTRDVGTNTPTPAAKPKVNAEALIQEANKAITLGADPVQVKQRLKEQYGVEVK